MVAPVIQWLLFWSLTPVYYIMKSPGSLEDQSSNSLQNPEYTQNINLLSLAPIATFLLPEFISGTDKQRNASCQLASSLGRGEIIQSIYPTAAKRWPASRRSGEKSVRLTKNLKKNTTAGVSIFTYLLNVMASVEQKEKKMLIQCQWSTCITLT